MTDDAGRVIRFPHSRVAGGNRNRPPKNLGLTPLARRIVAHGRPGDGVIGISTSGNSESLMAAFRKAKAMGLVTMGLTGMSGGEMAQGKTLDHCLVVHTDSIHRIQECHVAIYHIPWDLVHTLLADERGAMGAGDVNSGAEGKRP